MPPQRQYGLACDQDGDEWQQVTPGERFKIRASAAQTMGAYTVIEVVAEPGNGVPLHIHSNEEGYFIVLDGILDIAIGKRRWDAVAGVGEVDKITAIAAHYGTELVGPPLHERVHSISSPRRFSGR